MSSYREALEFIYSLSNFEASRSRAAEHFNLARIAGMLEVMGNPETRYKIVHVAGTKGKGSVCAMLESILRASGHRTGLYISPHLHTFRERIRVTGNDIEKDEFASWIDGIRPLIEATPGVSTFEVATAIAFAHFAQQGVEIAVLEVGLGGRLDATNVVRPLVSVITSISHDHMAILGDTLAKIAYEKAGIIKNGTPVVSAPQHPEALSVIQSVCAKRDAPLILVDQDWTCEPIHSDLNGQSFSLSYERIPGVAYPCLSMPLLGDHQLINATTAVATVRVLQESGVTVPESAVQVGLEEVHWPARLEILNRQPLLVVDGAHNDESCQRLADALQHHFDYRQLILIFGASAGKDHAAMLKVLRSLDPAAVIIAKADHPRATDPAILRSFAESLGILCHIVPPTAAALQEALTVATEDDLICACGSLFIAAEIREAWMSHSGLPLPPRDPFGM